MASAATNGGSSESVSDDSAEFFDASKPVSYAQPLKALKRNAALMSSLSVFSADIGPDNFCYWVGRYNAAEQRVETLSWPRFSLLGDTASSRWAYMTEAVLTDLEAARCTDYMIEQQKPINAISKHAENVGAYGLSAALSGALCAATRLRPRSARRVFIRSPVHKFHVLGLECPSKKSERKKLSRRLALNYLVRCEPTKSLAWKTWLANDDKQDDLADAMVGGLAYLIELDEQSPQPKLATAKRALLGLAPHERLPSTAAAAAAAPTNTKAAANGSGGSPNPKKVAFAALPSGASARTGSPKPRPLSRKQKLAAVLEDSYSTPSATLATTSFRKKATLSPARPLLSSTTTTTIKSPKQ